MRGGGIGFSGFRGGFDKGDSGGLRPPSELCFGTSGIECSASWSYIRGGGAILFFGALRQSLIFKKFARRAPNLKKIT